MALDGQIKSLAIRLGTEFKKVYGQVGNLASLNTTAKTDLVSALNEALAGNGAKIDDANNSTTKTNSSSKIAQLITDAKAAVKSDILGGAAAAVDTLKEIADLEASDIAAVLAGLANRLRVDVNNQGLTTTQIANGQTNLNVYDKSAIGDVTTNFVTTFETALA